MIEAIVKAADTSFDKKGVAALPDGTTVSLHVAHDGATLTVPRVVAITLHDDLVQAEGDKGELFFLSLSDLFAATVHAAGRKSGRQAGFLR